MLNSRTIIRLTAIVLCGVFFAGWIRSLATEDTIGYAVFGGTVWMMRTEPHRISFSRIKLNYADYALVLGIHEPGWFANSRRWRGMLRFGDDIGLEHRLGLKSPPFTFHFGSLHMANNPPDVKHGGFEYFAGVGLLRDENQICIQFWFIGAVLLVIILKTVALDRRSRQRLAHGLCVTCGYDLRSNTSGVCSECGTNV